MSVTPASGISVPKAMATESLPRGASGIVTLNSIQFLRAYAAIAVMIGHGLLETDATLALDRTHHYPWTAGVHIFFVISGFIMAYTSASAFGSPGAARMFVVRRLQRIVPLYWLVTTVLLLALLAGTELRSTALDWHNAAASYLFWPEARPSGQVVPLLSVGWTLNYEMMFYAIFAVGLLFPQLPALVGVSAILLILAAMHAFVSESAVALHFWTDPIIVEFVGGIWIGYAFCRVGKRHASYPAALATMTIGFALLFAGGTIEAATVGLPSWLAYGVPAMILVASAALLFPPSLEAAVPRLIILLGNSSYALYLTHRFPLRLVSETGQRFGVDQPAVYLVAAIISCLAVAVLTHSLIERPMMSRFRDRRRVAEDELAP